MGRATGAKAAQQDTGISPTPVLDALEGPAGVEADGCWDGAISALLARISKVDIVSMTDRYASACAVYDDAFPEQETNLSDNAMWVELRTPIFPQGTNDDDGFDVGVRTGILFEDLSPDRNQTENWRGGWQRATFVFLLQDFPVVLPFRVLVAAGCYGKDAYPLKEIRADVTRFDFPDFERMRHGLQPAATATPEQLLQMASTVVELGGKLFFSIGSRDVTPFYTDLPRYSAAVENGVEGLRCGLMSTCVERCEPPSDSLAHRDFARLGDVLIRGPVIALNVLAAVEQPRWGEVSTANMPEPFARGRRGVILDSAPRANVVPLR